MAGVDDARKFGVAKRKKDKNFVRDKLAPKKPARRGKKLNSQAKGKRGEKEALEITMEVLDLSRDDIRRCVGQERGTDFKKTSEYCRNVFPFEVEVKNQEKPRFWQCWEQTAHNATKGDGQPLMLIKRNNQPFLAVLEYGILLRLIKVCFDKSTPQS